MERLNASDGLDSMGDVFCSDPIWDSDHFIGSSRPKFTECFQHTILVYVPCSLLWLPLPFYLYAVTHNGRRPLPLSRLSVTKTFFSAFLLILTLVLTIDAVRMDINDERLVTPAEYLSYALRCASYAIMACIAVYERYRHVTTSCIGFIFWFTIGLCDVVTLYDKITTEVHVQFPIHFCLYSSIYVTESVLLLLHCLADFDGVHEYRPRMSPEVRASFISKIGFLWIRRIMYIGWKRELTDDDLCHLHPRDASNTLIPPFEKRWKEKGPGPRRRIRQGIYGQQYRQKGSEEKQSLLGDLQFRSYSGSGGKCYKATTSFAGSGTGAWVPDYGKKKQPCLFRILVRLKAGQLLLGLLQKTTSDVLLLLAPIIMSFLIDYADDRENQPSWWGYTLASLLFVSQVFKSVLFNHSFWTGELVGMQLKTTMIAAIYKKTLTMTNLAKQEYTAGEIVNLMSVDCNRIQDVMNGFYFAWTTPLQAIAVVTILYNYIGWSVFAGLGALLTVIPINSCVAALMQRLQRQNLELKDERLRLVNEALAGMKVIKFYAWEPTFQERIRAIRRKESKIMLKIAYLAVALAVIFTSTPFLVTLATFGVYVNTSDQNVLDAKKTFITLSYFGILRVPLLILTSIISMTIQAFVSVKRINKFLCTEDLNPDNVIRDPDSEYALDMDNGSFTWDRRAQPTLKDIQVKIPEGTLTAVVGTVGSGKSSLLSAFLGEMDKLSGRVSVKGSIAYVTQQAWIQNATIRENILFGQAFNKRRYKQVLFACALEQDLQILSAGDLTEIGEKGINLSGGQKQRVSLARAVYSGADVYFLDDPLSAVDSHVGRHIFNNVISKQGLLQDKTCILVTHGVHWLPMVDQVVVMKEGTVTETGSYDSLMAHNGPFAQLIRTVMLSLEAEDWDEHDDIHQLQSQILSDVENLFSETSSSSQSEDKGKRTVINRSREKQSSMSPVSRHRKESHVVAGRLTQEEKIESGKVKMSVYATYAVAAGVVPLVISFAFNGFFQVVSSYGDFWLSDWTQDPTLTNASLKESPEFKDKQDYYLAVYGVLGIVQIVLLTINTTIYWQRAVMAARRLHMAVLKTIFRCPMAFFDTTPLGRIMNRFSRDIEVVDNTLPSIIRDYTVSLANCVRILVVISINTPLFLTILVPVVILYLLIQMFYIPTSRQLKRLESVSRSPIFGHFSETISGASTIRAYQKADWFVDESKRRVDHNQSLYYLSLIVNRSISFYLELVSDVIIFGSALFAILSPGIHGAILGLSVSYAIQSSSNLVWMVRQRSDLETNIISIERLKEYTELASEAQWIDVTNRPTRDWPAQGTVQFKDYMTRYRPGLDLVLKGISCNFKAGEKVGIVGRTGAGKSSLTLALFRLIEASGGSIWVDGVQISDIGLHDLRPRLTILPQDPVLFYGSLRMNLDPMDQHTDDQLWQALTSAHLKDFVQTLPECLDYQVGEEGHNLSVGQRQLVCLARALLKKTKILILDEATASVDMETDQLIQNTLKTEFKDSTILAIAHRLNTIMDYDRILVLDNGHVQEMDTPANLLTNTDSAFYAMAKDANLL